MHAEYEKPTCRVSVWARDTAHVTSLPTKSSVMQPRTMPAEPPNKVIIRRAAHHLNFSKPLWKRQAGRQTRAYRLGITHEHACSACPPRAGVPLFWMQDAVGARSVTTGWNLYIRSCQSWGYYRSRTTLPGHRLVSRLRRKPLQSSRRGQIGFGSCAGLAGWLGQAGWLARPTTSDCSHARMLAWRLPSSLPHLV